MSAEEERLARLEVEVADLRSQVQAALDQMNEVPAQLDAQATT